MSGTKTMRPGWRRRPKKSFRYWIAFYGRIQVIPTRQPSRKPVGSKSWLMLKVVVDAQSRG